MSASGRSIFARWRVVLGVLERIIFLFPRSLCLWFYVCLRGVAGRPGMVCRYLLLRRLCLACGTNVSVHDGVYIKGFDKLTIGSNVSIHPMCYIDGSGGLQIGDGVSIAHSSSVLTTSHTWGDLSLPIKYNPVIYAPVFICSDVWIGCGVRVLGGAVVRSRSVLAAGAVYRDGKGREGSVYAGVPARVVKTISVPSSA